MAAKPALVLNRLQESDLPAWAWQGIRRRRDELAPPSGWERHAIATDDPALMRVLEPSSAVRWIVRVVEVSRSRLRFIAQLQPESGSLIQLHIKQTSVLARVRSAEPLNDSARPGYFQVAVEIQHMF